MTSYDVLKDFEKQLKENIDNMSNDDIERYNVLLNDLYLKLFYNNEAQGPMTNNVFLDKPWVNNYRDVPLKIINLFDTLYDNFKNTVENGNDEKCIFVPSQGNFNGQELLDMTDKFSTGLQKIGIDVGDNIGLVVNSSIEQPVSLLSASKIGACAMYLDFTKSVDDIKGYIEAADSKILMIDEMFLGMEPYINVNNVPVIVLNTKNDYNDGHYISFDRVLDMGKDKKVKEVDKIFERPVAIIFSSGTTGKAKPIIHNNYSVNMAAQKMLFTDFDLNSNSVMLQTVPPHIGLGLITTLYTSLVSGTKLYFIQAPGPKESVMMTTEFIKNFKTFLKDNNLSFDTKLTLFSAPMFYRAICNFLGDAEDLSFINGMLAAGSKMSADELKMMEDFFKSKNCNIRVCNAYGQNENAGAVSSNINKANAYGSGGIPVIGTEVKVINDNNEILGVYEEGEFVVQTPSQFIGYNKMDEMTKKQMIELKDGNTYFKTNDIGYMDCDGFLWITGRKTRVMIIDDCKVPVDLVEAKIRMSKYVKDCAMVPLKVGETDMDNPVLFLSILDEYKDSISWVDIYNELQKTIYKLNDLEMPNEVLYLEDIPALSSGKHDYVNLENMAKNKNETKQLVLRKESV